MKNKLIKLGAFIAISLALFYARPAGATNTFNFPYNGSTWDNLTNPTFPGYDSFYLTCSGDVPRFFKFNSGSSLTLIPVFGDYYEMTFYPGSVTITSPTISVVRADNITKVNCSNDSAITFYDTLPLGAVPRIFNVQPGATLTVPDVRDVANLSMAYTRGATTLTTITATISDDNGVFATSIPLNISGTTNGSAVLRFSPAPRLFPGRNYYINYTASPLPLNTSTFNFRGLLASGFGLDGAMAANTAATVGAFLTDPGVANLLALVVGVPLAFWIMRRLLQLYAYRKE